MTPVMLSKLLNALPECSEWGRVYILDFIGAHLGRIKDAEEVVARVVPNLAH